MVAAGATLPDAASRRNNGAPAMNASNFIQRFVLIAGLLTRHQSNLESMGLRP
jgi:hypothetical protein